MGYDCLSTREDLLGDTALFGDAATTYQRALHESLTGPPWSPLVEKLDVQYANYRSQSFLLNILLLKDAARDQPSPGGTFHRLAGSLHAPLSEAVLQMMEHKADAANDHGNAPGARAQEEEAFSRSLTEVWQRLEKSGGELPTVRRYVQQRLLDAYNQHLPDEKLRPLQLALNEVLPRLEALQPALGDTIRTIRSRGFDGISLHRGAPGARVQTTRGMTTVPAVPAPANGRNA